MVASTLNGTLPLDEVVIDLKCYPRVKMDKGKVSLYADALRGGADFPPILVERGTKILIDGRHRHGAHLDVGAEEIEVEWWEDAVLLGLLSELNQVPTHSKAELDAISNLERQQQVEREINLRKELLEKIRVRRLLAAAAANSKHGLPMESAEKREVARAYVSAIDDGDKIDVDVIATRLGVSRATCYEWVKDLMTARTAERDNLIRRLSLLGWTQEKIAKKVSDQIEEIKQSTLSEGVLSEIPELEKTIKAQLDAGRSVDWIAQHQQLDETLVWALLCQGKTDKERFDLLKLKPETFNLWEFSVPDPRIGQDHPGRIPGQILLNLLYYYTEPGDWVYDPMAGGGVTLDAALLLGRKAYASDIEPRRKDILEKDIATGFSDPPRSGAHPKLIFLDPPYWSQKKGDYSEDGMNWVNLTLEEFDLQFVEFVGLASKTLPSGGYLAVIVGPSQKAGRIYDHAYAFYAQMDQTHGLEFVNRIIVPYTTNQVAGFDVEQARSGKYMLKLYRDLLVFRKQ